MSEKHELSLLTARDISRVLNVQASTVYSWVKKRKIPHIKLGDKTIRFDYKDVQKWINQNKQNQL